jgi:hypothetical protein
MCPEKGYTCTLETIVIHDLLRNLETSETLFECTLAKLSHGIYCCSFSFIIDHALVVSISARVGVDLAHNGLATIIMSYGITGFSKVTSLPFW